MEIMYYFGIFIIFNITGTWAETVTYYDQALSWSDAVRFCQKEGGSIISDVTMDGLSDIPQTGGTAWIGRQIARDSRLILMMGCFYSDPDAKDKFSSVQIRSEFSDCIRGCPLSKYIGVVNDFCYCLNDFQLSTMTRRNQSLCDYITSTGCPWLAPPFVACGGVWRMSVYRVYQKGFSLPTKLLGMTEKILCTKWKSSNDNGLLSLEDCQADISAYCEHYTPGLKNYLLYKSATNWSEALKHCHDIRRELPTCDKDSPECLTYPMAMTSSSDEFWIGGFGQNIAEYLAENVNLTDLSQSLCGTFNKYHDEILYLPCEEKRPFICKLQSNVVAIVIGSMIAGSMVLVSITAVVFLCIKRRSKHTVRVRNSLAALDIMRHVGNEYQSDVQIVNDYSTIDESQMRSSTEVVRANVNTDYNELVLQNRKKCNSTTPDLYDHAGVVRPPGTDGSKDDYDHLAVKVVKSDASNRINNKTSEEPIDNLQDNSSRM